MTAVLGVDVGTGSARAAVFDPAGRRLGHGVRPIQMWRPAPDFVEQSGDDIWRAVCAAVREAVAEAGAVTITGIGFDATCSLVVRDARGGPVSVSPSGDPERDVIVWMDHRALDQTARMEPLGQQGAGLCRRHHVARDGDAQAVMAEGEPGGEFGPGVAFFRPAGFPDMARDGGGDALAVLGRV